MPVKPILNLLCSGPCLLRPEFWEHTQQYKHPPLLEQLSAFIALSMQLTSKPNFQCMSHTFRSFQSRGDKYWGRLQSQIIYTKQPMQLWDRYRHHFRLLLPITHDIHWGLLIKVFWVLDCTSGYCHWDWIESDLQWQWQISSWSWRSLHSC